MKKAQLFMVVGMALILNACSSPNEVRVVVDYSHPITPEALGIIQTIPEPGTPVSLPMPTESRPETMFVLGPGVSKPHHFWFLGPTFRNATLVELLSFEHAYRVSGDLCALGTSYSMESSGRIHQYPFVRNGTRLGYHLLYKCDSKLLVQK